MDAVVELDRLTGAIVADLPKPPSMNTYWRNWHGRTVISGEGRAFRELVVMACRLGRIKPLTGSLAVSMTFHPATKGRNDLDNRIKVCLDAMQHGGCYLDDSQIDDLRIVRGPVVAGGRVMVRVIEIQGNAA